MLRLINMRAHRHNTAYARGITLARPGTRCMHNTILCAPQKIRAPAKPIQHPAPHDTRTIRMRVNIHFDRRVHADDAQPADYLGGIADLLAAQQQLGRVFVPVVVEALEPAGRKADRSRGCEVEVARVEEVEEGVLEDLGPDLEVFEVGAAGLRGSATLS